MNEKTTDVDSSNGYDATEVPAERAIEVEQMTEVQFRAVEAAIGLPINYLGQYNTGRRILLTAQCGPNPDLDAAVRYLREQRLVYVELRAARHTPARPR